MELESIQEGPATAPFMKAGLLIEPLVKWQSMSARLGAQTSWTPQPYVGDLPIGGHFLSLVVAKSLSCLGSISPHAASACRALGV